MTITTILRIFSFKVVKGVEETKGALLSGVCLVLNATYIGTVLVEALKAAGTKNRSAVMAKMVCLLLCVYNAHVHLNLLKGSSERVFLKQTTT